MNAKQKLSSRKWDRDGRTQALLTAAMKVFSERGFDAATTKGIAEAAHCSEGLIARYFGGKEGLFIAVIKDQMARTKPLTGSNGQGSGDLATILRAIMQSAGAHMWESRPFMRITHGRAMVDAAFAGVLGQLLTGKQREIVELLATLADTGLIAREQDLNILALSMMAAVFQVGFLHPLMHGTELPAVMAGLAGCADLLSAGLTATAAKNPRNTSQKKGDAA